MGNKSKRNYFIIFLWQMLQINCFKTIKLISCIIDIRIWTWRHTARTPRTSEIPIVSAETCMYLSQNNAYKLNNYPLLLDKKLSTYHRRRFLKEIIVKYLQQSTFSSNIEKRCALQILDTTIVWRVSIHDYDIWLCYIFFLYYVILLQKENTLFLNVLKKEKLKGD